VIISIRFDCGSHLTNPYWFGRARTVSSLSRSFISLPLERTYWSLVDTSHLLDRGEAGIDGKPFATNETFLNASRRRRLDGSRRRSLWRKAAVPARLMIKCDRS
jgi:hypothetical protein